MPQKRKGISKPRHKPFFQEYNFELTVIFLIALGVFLLVEEMEIKHYLFIAIKAIFSAIGGFVIRLRDGSIFLIDKFEVSDLVGISLIGFAFFLVANRWRERMIERYSILKDCPSCGGGLHRMRREPKHKLLGLFYWVHVKHYHCKACSYKGTKISKK